MYQTKCFWNVINKYMYMPFNITSHTNVQFDLEKQSHSMLSMHYRSLYHLCLFSHCGVRKPVTTLALYVCALNAHYFNTDVEVNSVFRSSFWQPNTFWTSKKHNTQQKFICPTWQKSIFLFTLALPDLAVLVYNKISQRLTYTSHYDIDK